MGRATNAYSALSVRGWNRPRGLWFDASLLWLTVYPSISSAPFITNIRSLSPPPLSPLLLVSVWLTLSVSLYIHMYVYICIYISCVYIYVCIMCCLYVCMSVYISEYNVCMSKYLGQDVSMHASLTVVLRNLLFKCLCSAAFFNSIITTPTFKHLFL